MSIRIVSFPKRHHANLHGDWLFQNGWVDRFELQLSRYDNKNYNADLLGGIFIVRSVGDRGTQIKLVVRNCIKDITLTTRLFPFIRSDEVIFSCRSLYDRGDYLTDRPHNVLKCCRQSLMHRLNLSITRIYLPMKDSGVLFRLYSI